MSNSEKLEDLKEELSVYLNTVETQYPYHALELIHQLAECAYEPARDYFMSLLRYHFPNSEIRLGLVEALGFHWTNYKDSIPILTYMLLSVNEDDSVRLACAAALGSLQAESSIPALSMIASGEAQADEDIRQAAVYSLIEISEVPTMTGHKLSSMLTLDTYALFSNVTTKTKLDALIQKLSEEKGIL